MKDVSDKLSQDTSFNKSYKLSQSNRDTLAAGLNKESSEIKVDLDTVKSVTSRAAQVLERSRSIEKVKRTNPDVTSESEINVKLQQ